MSANALLSWMSARREGSWQQFRAAVEELHLGAGGDSEAGGDDAGDQFGLPLYQNLRLNLQRFGHAEFFSGTADADWRVTPPALAVTEHRRGWLGVVAGARSTKVLERIRAAAVQPEILEELPFSAAPDALRVIGSDAGILASFADRAGLRLQDDAPGTILMNLPAVDDHSVGFPAEMPFGTDWRVDRFSSRKLVWEAAATDGVSPGNGLFRFSLRHERKFFYRFRGRTKQVPGQVGKYLVLRRSGRHVVRYDAEAQRLSFPASCRPPLLIERALLLCSGSLPSYERNGRLGVLHYADVPRRIAACATLLLRQELR